MDACIRAVTALIVLLFLWSWHTSVTQRDLFRCGPIVLTTVGYIFMLLLAGSMATAEIRGLLYALNLKIGFDEKKPWAYIPPNQLFQAGGLRGLQIIGFGGDHNLPTPYVGKVQDGLELLKRTGNSKKAVASFDFTNPFNLARSVKPPGGSTLGWDLGMIFSATSAPDADQVFRGAEVVMVPKNHGGGDPRNLDVIGRLYGTYLNDHYKLAGESQQWLLYEQR